MRFLPKYTKASTLVYIQFQVLLSLPKLIVLLLISTRVWTNQVFPLLASLLSHVLWEEGISFNTLQYFPSLVVSFLCPPFLQPLVNPKHFLHCILWVVIRWIWSMAYRVRWSRVTVLALSLNIICHCHCIDLTELQFPFYQFFKQAII